MKEQESGILGLQREVLSEPDVIFYLDGSEVSEQLIAVLDEAKIRFEARASGASCVFAEFGGMRFEGLEKALILIDALKKFEEVLIRGVRKEMPELFGKTDKSLSNFMEQSRLEKVAEAKDLVARLKSQQ